MYIYKEKEFVDIRWWELCPIIEKDRVTDKLCCVFLIWIHIDLVENRFDNDLIVQIKMLYIIFFLLYNYL